MLSLDGMTRLMVFAVGGFSWGWGRWGGYFFVRCCIAALLPGALFDMLHRRQVLVANSFPGPAAAMLACSFILGSTAMA